MLRYLNMFVLIGIALVVISLAGFATGGRFLQEPGSAVSPNASLIYLGAGALMLFNGILSIRTAPVQTTKPDKSSDDDEEKPGEGVEPATNP
jgi:hypothetical protein